MPTIFRTFLAIVILASARNALGGCLTRDVAQTPGSFKTYYFCKNTLSSPQYQYSSFLDSDNTFSLFSFDPKGASIICHEFEIGRSAGKKCESWNRRFEIPDRYESRNYVVRMIDLGSEDDRRLLSTKLSSTSLEYSTQSTMSDIRSSACFAGVDIDDNAVFLGYVKEEFEQMPICLTMLEDYFKRNKNVLMKLIKP